MNVDVLLRHCWTNENRAFLGDQSTRLTLEGIVSDCVRLKGRDKSI